MADPLSIELLSPPDMFRGQTYEHAAVVGDFVFVAGQVSRNARGETVAPNESAGQIVQVYANLRRVLEFAGCEAADVVKVTTYLVDAADAQVVLAAHQQFFATHRPPHTLVIVHALTRPDMRLEVDVIARRRRAQNPG
jgi:enamine deaminase RidA (YjgF/YER057c/UK114 family)